MVTIDPIVEEIIINLRENGLVWARYKAKKEQEKDLDFMQKAGKKEEEGSDSSDDEEDEKKDGADPAGGGEGGLPDKSELDKNPNSDEESKGPYENLNKKYDRMKGTLIGN